MDEEKSSEKKLSFTKLFRKNPWILSTFVLGILSLILITGTFGAGSGKVISDVEAGDAISSFIQSQGVDADVKQVDTEDNFYKVTISYQGQNVPLYVTKDGDYLVQGLTPLVTTSQSTEVLQTDRPKVELFIWAYCPYGVQAQGPMAEVASLLGDYADFETILYYDGHGAHETQENKIEACIQEISPDKYWDYAAGFVKDIYPKCGASRDINCDREESLKLMNSLGIDSAKIMSCVSSQGESLNNAAAQYASQLGVTGSPTIIINGVKVNVGRDAESIKTAVCEAFNDAPVECDVALSSSSATASGNC